MGVPDIDFRKILIAGVVVGGVVVGAVIGLTLWLAPIIWAWLKPILHSATS